MFKLVLIALFFSTNAVAQEEVKVSCCRDTEFHLVDVDELNFEHTKIKAKRDPYFQHIDQDDWRYGGALNWNVRLLQYFYWRNQFHFDYETQIREVGWKYEYGANLGNCFDAFVQHHSRHANEEPKRAQRFPVDDRYGIRINFIKDGRKCYE